MIKKRFLKKVICVNLLVVSLFSMSISANAAPKDKKNIVEAQEVFNKSEVDMELEKAKNSPIQPDKVNAEISSDASSDGSVSVSGFGTYPTRYGVILVTADYYKGLIPTGHAAIIWSSTKVVEALANGVVTGSNNWNTTKSTCYGVTTIGTTTAQDNAASNWCYAQKGKPYNYNYLNPSTREKFYCSQLVYASFLDLYGINLDTSAFSAAVHPMELVNSSNTYTIYQK